MNDEQEEPLMSEEATTSDNFRRKSQLRTKKPKNLKRRLVFIIIAACSIIVTIYYTTQLRMSSLETEEGSRVIENFHISTLVRNRTKEILWTWICNSGTCERHHTTEDYIVQSFVTCNMLCGKPQIWPIPTGTYSISQSVVPVKVDDYDLYVIKSPSNIVTIYITKAFDLFKEDLKKTELKVDKNNGGENIAPYKVVVHVAVEGDSDPRLRLDTDESYKLSVNAKHDDNTLLAVIKANSFCGMRNGLETLSQLVWVDPYYEILLSFDEAYVQDAPKFKYRGMLLDTARNFFPVSDIIRTLDAMSANKLNTFHWHATDSQSFPLVLNAAPQLAYYGAYRPDALYTRKDIQAIVRHASLRGIRVVIEIDAPGHVGSAFSWKPVEDVDKLAFCINKEPWTQFCGEPPCGQLNPKNEYVFNLLEKIYSEIIKLTGVTDVFHLGGDEINENCWKTHFSGDNPSELYLNFVKDQYKVLKTSNGGQLPQLTILWSSKYSNRDLPHEIGRNELTFQLWEEPTSMNMLDHLNKGFRSVLSPVNAWYFDCGMGSWRDSSLKPCAPYRKWHEVYDHRPWVPPEDKGMNNKNWSVVGGEACMWTELLDPNDLDTRLWPRGIAIAERLWSDPDHKVNPTVISRIETQRDRLKARGIKVKPIWPKWCTQNPNACL